MVRPSSLLSLSLFFFPRFRTHFDVDVHGFGVIVLVVCVVFSHHQHPSFDLVGQALALVQHVELQPSDVSDPPRHRHRPSHRAPHRFVSLHVLPILSFHTFDRTCRCVVVVVDWTRFVARRPPPSHHTDIDDNGIERTRVWWAEGRPRRTTTSAMATCTCSDENDTSRATEGEMAHEEMEKDNTCMDGGETRRDGRRERRRRTCPGTRRSADPRRCHVHALHDATVQMHASCAYVQKASRNAPPSSACSLASLHQQRWRGRDAREAEPTPRLAST